MAVAYEQTKFQKNLPTRLIISGILIIILGIAILLFVAWFLEYSDKITGNITITTSTQPLEIPAQTSGNIQLLVPNESIVKKGQAIAYIDNNTNSSDVLALENLLAISVSPIEQARAIHNSSISELGTLQTSFLQVKNALAQYDNFLITNDKAALSNTKNKNIQLYKERLTLLSQKTDLAQQDIALAKKQAEGKERLAQQATIANAEFERALQEKISKEFANLSNEEAINAIKIQITEQEEDLIEINSQYQADLKTYQNDIQAALSTFKNDIALWKEQYFILANRNGKCVWSEYLEDDEYVTASQILCTIVADKAEQQMGQMEIAMKGAGKVALGQEVNILLDHFPANEFGILKGKVGRVAPLPENNVLKVEVALPEQLTSTYDITFDIQQLASGRAEIITNKMSFAQRIWNDLKGRRLNN